MIHTVFERGFIRVEVIAYEDFVACNGEQGAKEAGKLRLEGKDYVVRDGIFPDLDAAYNPPVTRMEVIRVPGAVVEVDNPEFARGGITHCCFSHGLISFF